MVCHLVSPSENSEAIEIPFAFRTRVGLRKLVAFSGQIRGECCIVFIQHNTAIYSYQLECSRPLLRKLPYNYEILLLLLQQLTHLYYTMSVPFGGIESIALLTVHGGLVRFYEWSLPRVLYYTLIVELKIALCPKTRHMQLWCAITLMIIERF